VADQTQKARKVVPLPSLTFRTGPMTGKSITLGESDGTIGRRDDCTYVIEEPRVSRLHASVRKDSGAVILTDLGSSAGTKVNGDELTGPRVLRHGDRVSFGPVEAVFEDPAAAAADDEATMVFEIPRVDSGPHLSPRQQQVLELMAEGMTNNEIGEQLGVTERTVKAYAQELYDKLGVRNRAGAVAEAAKLGLLQM
jgi:DNA-binding CsgD family transcriptional regulator